MDRNVHTPHQQVKRPRCLIVDDDQFSQIEIVRHIYGVYNIGLIVVYTPEEAIEILKSVKIDFALIDHRFPSHPTGGIDVVKFINTMEKPPKCYVCSVVEHPYLVDEYEKLKIDGIIGKMELKAKLPNVFDGYKM